MPTHTFAFGIGIWELGIVLVIVLLIFGAGKLPGVGAALGKSLAAFKKNVQDDPDEPKAVQESKPAEKKAIESTEDKPATD